MPWVIPRILCGKAPARAAGRRVEGPPDGSVAPLCAQRWLLADGLQVERDDPLSDPPSEHESVLACAPEVDAGIDARIRALPRRLREARERSSEPLERLPARDPEL